MYKQPRKDAALSRRPSWYTVDKLLQQDREPCCGAVTWCRGKYGEVCAKTVAIRYVRYLLSSYKPIPNGIFETIMIGDKKELEELCRT